MCAKVTIKDVVKQGLFATKEIQLKCKIVNSNKHLIN